MFIIFVCVEIEWSWCYWIGWVRKTDKCEIINVGEFVDF